MKTVIKLLLFPVLAAASMAHLDLTKFAVEPAARRGMKV
jgi:hypothetical protein